MDEVASPLCPLHAHTDVAACPDAIVRYCHNVTETQTPCSDTEAVARANTRAGSGDCFTQGARCVARLGFLMIR